MSCGTHEGEVGQVRSGEGQPDVQFLVIPGFKVGVKGGTQAVSFAFLDGQQPRLCSNPGKVAGSGCHHHQGAAWTEDAHEFLRVPWREDHHHHVHGVVGQRERPPDVPHEVHRLRISPRGPSQCVLGDVQTNSRRGRHAVQDGVEVVSGPGSGVEDYGARAGQPPGNVPGKCGRQWGVMAAVQEAPACFHHAWAIGFEDGALARQQVEIALFCSVEPVSGLACQGQRPAIQEPERPLAHGTTQGLDSRGGHGFNPTVVGVSDAGRRAHAARLTHVKPEQLPLVNTLSAPAIHPDGSRAVVSVTRPDFNADDYVGQLWSVPLDPTKYPRRITRGFRDTAPAFSPDGLVLAFLRPDADGKPQLFVVESAGGEPQRVTNQRCGVSGFSWAPDSHRIVFTARVPEPGRYGTVDGVTPGREDARLIAVNKYRMNGVGYVSDQRLQVFVLDLPELGGEPVVKPRGRAAHEMPAAEFADVPAARQLTFDDADHDGATFSSDGRHIYFLAAAHEGNDNDLVTSMYKVAAAGGDASVVHAGHSGPQNVTAVRESANGRSLFFTAQDLGESGTDFVARNSVLFAVSLGQPGEDPAEPVALTDAEHLDVSGPLEQNGPDSVLVLNTVAGTVELLTVSSAGDITPLVFGPKVVTGATVAANGEIAVSFQDGSTAGDVASLEGGELRLLTDFSAALRNYSRIVEPVAFEVESGDGHPVHGWVVLPDGPGPHPALLTIHGGPFAQYTGAFFDEAQVYAAAGYAVVMCNPRGSSGYGQAHGRAIKGQMGTLDMQDVLAFFDAAVAAHPVIDAARTGIMGGSYGGYLSAWIIAHDHRFEAAVVERGFLDPVSFAGSSDIGWFFGGEYTGGTPEQLLARSPMAVASAVKTPTLVIHSENDLRCPLEQGQRYYATLKASGVDTAFLVFPGEDHELSRSGTPHHRRQRFEHILAWWAVHLPTPLNPAISA